MAKLRFVIYDGDAHIRIREGSVRVPIGRCGGVGILLLLSAVLGCSPPASQSSVSQKARLLVTNDNGIDDVATIELARALAKTGAFEVVVVASMQDRSGASNYMTATRAGRYRVSRRDLGADIEAWALDGEPADCVVFALSGPMRERPPDLVVSGINGGPNLGDDWFGSGTIGAARTAAYFGVPSIAVSGVEDDDPASVAAASTWVVEFVQSDLVRQLRAPQYLTVSLPLGPVGVRGARLVNRARGLISGGAEREAGEAGQDGEETWLLNFDVDGSKAGPNTDVRAVEEGYIAITAMRVDEEDLELRARLARFENRIPPWPNQQPQGADSTVSDPCDGGLGVMIDDAEDESGHEWGVLIEEVHDGGRAAAAGLLVGDVLTRFNGLDLASQPGSSVDPDEKFVDLYRKHPCESPLSLTVVREGREISVTLAAGSD